MKKLKYFTLAMVLVMSLIMSFTLYGCGKNESREYVATIDPTDTAVLTIFTYNGKTESRPMLLNLGHTFFSIENVSEDNIVIGKYTLTPHETIALGTWSVAEHFGVWYNLESNYIEYNGKYTGRLSVSIGINQADIDTINECIETMDRWTPLHNCSYFALTTWNKVASATEKIDTPLIYTPTHIANILSRFDTCVENKPIITKDTFGYYKGDDFVSHSFNAFVEVSDESI